MNVKKFVLTVFGFCAVLLSVAVLYRGECSALEIKNDAETLYVLNIDGEAVCSARSAEVIKAAVKAVADAYFAGEGSTVSFDNEVTVTKETGDINDTLPAAEIIKLISPENSGEFALTVRTVLEESHSEKVPFTVKSTPDGSMYVGEYDVIREGREGKAQVTEKIVCINGTEISRVETEYVVIEKPSDMVVYAGIAVRPAWASYGEYIRPCAGVVTSEFGYRNISVGSSYHKGIDIADELNSPVFAADGGEVTYAGDCGGYGLLVEIVHDNGDITRYAHCESLAVSVGDKVPRGETIAFMGSTGVSTGVHLHFEILRDGQATDPKEFIPV